MSVATVENLEAIEGDGWMPGRRDLAMAGVAATLIVVASTAIILMLMPLFGYNKTLTSFPSSVATAVVLTVCLAYTRKPMVLAVVGATVGLVYGFIYPAQVYLFPAYMVAGVLSAGWAAAIGGRRAAATLAVALGACILYRLVAVSNRVWLFYLFGVTTDETLIWGTLVLDAVLSVVGAIVGVVLGRRMLNRRGLI